MLFFKSRSLKQTWGFLKKNPPNQIPAGGERRHKSRNGLDLVTRSLQFRLDSYPSHISTTRLFASTARSFSHIQTDGAFV